MRLRLRCLCGFDAVSIMHEHLRRAHEEVVVIRHGQRVHVGRAGMVAQAHDAHQMSVRRAQLVAGPVLVVPPLVVAIGGVEELVRSPR